MKQNIYKIDGYVYVTTKLESINSVVYWIYICHIKGFDHGDNNNPICKNDYLPKSWFENLHDKDNYKYIIATNNPNLPIQQLTEKEVEYCLINDWIEVDKEKYSERFDNDNSPIGNTETWGKRYNLLIPTEQSKGIEELSEIAYPFEVGYGINDENTRIRELKNAFIECAKSQEPIIEQLLNDKAELYRRWDIIISEPNGVVRENMINDLFLNIKF